MVVFNEKNIAFFSLNKTTPNSVHSRNRGHDRKPRKNTMMRMTMVTGEDVSDGEADNS